MPILTIPKSITGREELIVIPRKEYERMRESTFPTFRLKGGVARKLDRRVSAGLRESRAGKTESLESFLGREYPRLARQYED